MPVIYISIYFLLIELMNLSSHIENVAQYTYVVFTSSGDTIRGLRCVLR